MPEAEAWVLYAGDGGAPRPGELVRERIVLPPLRDDEVAVATRYGCLEANTLHAVRRRPVDVCRQRGEPSMVPGNAAVVEVVDVGRKVVGWEPGQRAVLCAATVVDRHGFPQKVRGYDAPGTIGCLSTRMHVLPRELVPLSPDAPGTLAQWAAFSVRYVTAWSNWELAFGTFRLQIDAESEPTPDVWGWGGGTTLATLDLARRQGCRTVMLSRRADHRATIASLGITALNRTPFVNLAGEGPACEAAEKAFLELVRARTTEGVHVFVDYIGGALLRATRRALAREGVLTTAGWHAGLEVAYRRPVACIGRQQYVHTHYARHAQAVAAVAYGEQTGWMPPLDAPSVPFDELPRLVERMLDGDQAMFPTWSV